MLESEFRNAYRKAHEGIDVSDDLRERTLALVAKEAPNRANAVQPAEASAGQTGGANRSRTSAEKPPHAAKREGKRARSPEPRIVRRWGLAAAACLALAALATGLTLANPFGQPDPNEQPGTTASTKADGFVLQAYAATSNTLLEPGEDGTVVFSRDMGYSASSDYYDQDGCYTGCLFGVQGDGIVGVQASTSRGQLYRYTYEEFKVGDEPEKWREALSWDPTRRGRGAYYGAYDNVQPARTDSSQGSDDPDSVVQVRLAKKLGSTIDVDMAPGTSGDYYFGLWTNDPYETGRDPGEAAIDLFDGETLTVTVEFEDGSTATKVIALHAADMKAAWTDSGMGSAQGWEVLPETADRNALQEGESYVHTLYGVVTDENDGPFPGSLEQANELEDAPEPPAALSSEPSAIPEKDQDGNDFALQASNVLDSQGKALLAEANQTFERGNGTTYCADGNGTFEITNVHAKRLAQLPEGVSVLDTNVVKYGDLAYFNKCQREERGFAVTEDGRIEGAYAFVAVSMDVANTDDAQAFKNTSQFSKLVLRNEDGRCLILNAPLLYSDWWGHDRASEGFETRTALAAGEKRRMTQVFAAPAGCLHDSGLLFVVYDSFTSVPQNENYHAFAIGGLG
ncbi:hypothetical protein C1878_05655 [Gordonibacter sp. 28C]|nr:hypothetical protein C1878_05655 [Gordonibacter sp. 28C]